MIKIGNNEVKSHNLSKIADLLGKLDLLCVSPGRTIRIMMVSSKFFKNIEVFEQWPVRF